MRGRTLLSAMLALGVAAPIAARQAFHSTVDIVRVPVVVLTKAGTPVHGLKAEDFDVFENGRPQTLVAFAEGRPGPDVPLHLGLMLDRSESMELDLKATSDAAVRFLDAVDEAVDVTLVEFETTVQVSRFSPANYPQLFARLRHPTLGRFTALYDALGRYVETTRDRTGQHILVIYTDGGDSALGMTAGEVQRLLRGGDVMVYVLGYVDNLPSSERLRQESLLLQLARETGGEAYFPSSARDVTAVYTRIRAEIDGRYTLGYVSTDAARDGRFRKIDVQVHAPLAPGTRLRTRSGYLAPE